MITYLEDKQIMSMCIVHKICTSAVVYDHLPGGHRDHEFMNKICTSVVLCDHLPGGHRYHECMNKICTSM